MNLRLLATPLVAATLLLSTLGCSKNDDPAATPTPTPTPAASTSTGSFKRDGVTITGTSRAFRAQSVRDLKGNEITVIYIVITESPAQSISRSIRLEYRNAGSGYQIEEMIFAEGNSEKTFYPSTTSTATFKFIDGEVFGGTFSGTGTTSLATKSTLSDGVFTNARYF